MISLSSMDWTIDSLTEVVAADQPSLVGLDPLKLPRPMVWPASL